MPVNLPIVVDFQATEAIAQARLFNTTMTNMSNTVARLTPQILTLVGAFAGFHGLQSSIDTFARFERTMDRVGVLTGATADEFIRLNEAARRIGAETQLSANQAANAFAFLAQAGFTVTQSLQSVDSIVAASIANMTDLGRTADLVSNAITAFGLTAADTERVVDSFTVTAANSNTTMLQMSEGFSRTGAIARILGLRIEEVSAAIGVLGNAGIQGERATRGLATILTRLADAGREISGPDGILQAFQQLSTESLSVSQAVDLFGRNFTDVGLVLTENTESLRTLTQVVEEGRGTTNQFAEDMQDNLRGSLLELKSAFEEVVIAFGEDNSSGFRSIVDSTTGLVRDLGENIDVVEQGLNSLLIILGGSLLASALGGPLGLIVGLTTATSALIAFRETLQDSDSPGIRRLGNTLEGIREGVISLVQFVFPNFEDFTSGFFRVMDGLAGVVSSSINYISDFFTGLGVRFARFRTIVGDVIEDIGDLGLTRLGSALGNLSDSIYRFINGLDPRQSISVPESAVTFAPGPPRVGQTVSAPVITQPQQPLPSPTPQQEEEFSLTQEEEFSLRNAFLNFAGALGEAGPGNVVGGLAGGSGSVVGGLTGQQQDTVAELLFTTGSLPLYPFIDAFFGTAESPAGEGLVPRIFGPQTSENIQSALFEYQVFPSITETFQDIPVAGQIVDTSPFTLATLLGGGVYSGSRFYRGGDDFDVSSGGTRTPEQAGRAQDQIGYQSYRARNQFPPGYLGDAYYAYNTLVNYPVVNTLNFGRRVASGAVAAVVPNAAFRTGTLDAQGNITGQSLVNRYLYGPLRGNVNLNPVRTGTLIDGTPTYTLGDIDNLREADLRRINFALNANDTIDPLSPNTSLDSLYQFQRIAAIRDPADLGYVDNLILQRGRQLVANNQTSQITPDFATAFIDAANRQSGPFQRSRVFTLTRDIREQLLTNPNTENTPAATLFRDFTTPSGVVSANVSDLDFSLGSISGDFRQSAGEATFNFFRNLGSNFVSNVQSGSVTQAIFGALGDATIGFGTDVASRVGRRVRQQEIARQRLLSDEDRASQLGFNILDPTAGIDETLLAALEIQLGIPLAGNRGLGTTTLEQDQQFLTAIAGIDFGPEVNARLDELRSRVRSPETFQELEAAQIQQLSPTPTPPRTVTLPEQFTGDLQEFFAVTQSLLDEGISATDLNETYRNIASNYELQLNDLALAGPYPNLPLDRQDAAIRHLQAVNELAEESRFANLPEDRREAARRYYNQIINSGSSNRSSSLAAAIATSSIAGGAGLSFLLGSSQEAEANPAALLFSILSRRRQDDIATTGFTPEQNRIIGEIENLLRQSDEFSSFDLTIGQFDGIYTPELIEEARRRTGIFEQTSAGFGTSGIPDDFTPAQREQARIAIQRENLARRYLEGVEAFQREQVFSNYNTYDVYSPTPSQFASTLGQVDTSYSQVLSNINTGNVIAQYGEVPVNQQFSIPGSAATFTLESGYNNFINNFTSNVNQQRQNIGGTSGGPILEPISGTSLTGIPIPENQRFPYTLIDTSPLTNRVSSASSNLGNNVTGANQGSTGLFGFGGYTDAAILSIGGAAALWLLSGGAEGAEYNDGIGPTIANAQNLSRVAPSGTTFVNQTRLPPSPNVIGPQLSPLAASRLYNQNPTLENARRLVNLGPFVNPSGDVSGEEFSEYLALGAGSATRAASVVRLYNDAVADLDRAIGEALTGSTFDNATRFLDEFELSAPFVDPSTRSRPRTPQERLSAQRSSRTTAGQNQARIQDLVDPFTRGLGIQGALLLRPLTQTQERVLELTSQFRQELEDAEISAAGIDIALVQAADSIQRLANTELLINVRAAVGGVEGLISPRFDTLGLEGRELAEVQADQILANNYRDVEFPSELARQITIEDQRPRLVERLIRQQEVSTRGSGPDLATQTRRSIDAQGRRLSFDRANFQRDDSVALRVDRQLFGLSEQFFSQNPDAGIDAARNRAGAFRGQFTQLEQQREEFERIQESAERLNSTINRIANSFSSNLGGAINQVTDQWFGLADEGFNAAVAIENAFRRAASNIVASFFQAGINDFFSGIGNFIGGISSGDPDYGFSFSALANNQLSGSNVPTSPVSTGTNFTNRDFTLLTPSPSSSPPVVNNIVIQSVATGNRRNDVAQANLNAEKINRVIGEAQNQNSEERPLLR